MDTGKLLAKAGLRATGKRRLVAQALAEASEPMDASQIYRALGASGNKAAAAEVSLPTVYRTLGILEEAGIVESLHGRRAGIRYRLVPDHSVGELVCERCGKVEDLTDTPALAAFKEKVARDSSFAKPEGLRVYAGCRRKDCD